MYQEAINILTIGACLLTAVLAYEYAKSAVLAIIEDQTKG